MVVSRPGAQQGPPLTTLCVDRSPDSTYVSYLIVVIWTVSSGTICQLRQLKGAWFHVAQRSIVLNYEYISEAIQFQGPYIKQMFPSCPLLCTSENSTCLIFFSIASRLNLTASLLMVGHVYYSITLQCTWHTPFLVALLAAQFPPPIPLLPQISPSLKSTQSE